MAKPGWSERQYKKAKQSIDQWPQWMKANLNVRQAVEEERRAMLQSQSARPQHRKALRGSTK